MKEIWVMMTDKKIETSNPKRWFLLRCQECGQTEMVFRENASEWKCYCPILKELISKSEDKA